MEFLISFLEGLITFISPCLLPMLPIYVSYFVGGKQQSAKTKTALKNALGFVLGFTIIFVILGAFAGTVGMFLKKYHTAVNIISGIIVIFFGLSFAGVFKLKLFKGISTAKLKLDNINFAKSILFGMIFSIGWTPCVGAFLGSALMLASQQGSALTGIIMLLFYSAGLGVPFVLSAVLIDRLKSAFAFIKEHYRVINIVCGIFLILVGTLMATGTLGFLLSLLSF